MLKAVRALVIIGVLAASIAAPCTPAVALAPPCDMPDCGDSTAGAGHDCCCAAPAGPVEPARAAAEPGPTVKPVPTLWIAAVPEAAPHGIDGIELAPDRPCKNPPLHLLNASFLL